MREGAHNRILNELKLLTYYYVIGVWYKFCLIIIVYGLLLIHRPHKLKKESSKESSKENYKESRLNKKGG